MKTLYYGDNLDVLRKHIKDETVDLCYIDPPFNSKRSYNQIYNQIGTEDRAQAQAFTDAWVWDDRAQAGVGEIIANDQGRFGRKTIALIGGLHAVLGESSLMAYVASMALRIVEIHRALKPTGSFYLHCDPTASHYLKLVLDAVFVERGGDFLNEIVWNYQTGGASRHRYARKHDVLLYYSKSSTYTFNSDAIREARTEKSMARAQNPKGARIAADDATKLPTDVFQIQALNPMAKERLGYPTQKPEALLERLILASTNESDVVLDAYCGCGTTVAVAERLGRAWIGIDITYQSISLVVQRLEAQAGKSKWPSLQKTVKIDGIPRDMDSAVALAHKRDDRLRKEFEKWAVLTYTKNRGMIYEKKGADSGIDGVVYFLAAPTENASMVIQVKSGHVARGDIATLRGDMNREGAAMATLITLEDPTAPMIKEAKVAGQYQHEVMGRSYDRIQIVTVREIVESNRRLDLPMSLEVVRKAQSHSREHQIGLPGGVPGTSISGCARFSETQLREGACTPISFDAMSEQIGGLRWSSK